MKAGVVREEDLKEGARRGDDWLEYKKGGRGDGMWAGDALGSGDELVWNEGLGDSLSAADWKKGCDYDAAVVVVVEAALE